MTESPRKIGFSAEMRSRLIDRKISIAPMMDWTDYSHFYFCISRLHGPKRACLLYVSPKFRESQLLALFTEMRDRSDPEQTLRTNVCRMIEGTVLLPATLVRLSPAPRFELGRLLPATTEGAGIEQVSALGQIRSPPGCPQRFPLSGRNIGRKRLSHVVEVSRALSAPRGL